VEAMLARGLGAANFTEVAERLTVAKAAVRLAFNSILATKRTET
jgi:hypothetical protein